MTKPILTIVRGLPGAGKSRYGRALAEKTGALFLEPDMLHVKGGKYCYDDRAHEAAIVKIANHVGIMMCLDQCDIIVADVFPKLDDLAIYQKAANHSGYNLRVVEFVITPEESKKRNTHNVRHEDIDRMAAEWEDWPGAERIKVERGQERAG